MAWTTNGDERAKQFKVYRELEAQYEELRSHYRVLSLEMQRKNRLISKLAEELGKAIQAYGPLDMGELEEVAKERARASAATSMPTYSPLPYAATMPVPRSETRAKTTEEVVEKLADSYKASAMKAAAKVATR